MRRDLGGQARTRETHSRAATSRPGALPVLRRLMVEEDRMETLIAATWTAAGALALTDAAAREPRAGQALVRVRACGICGSDLHTFRGETAPLVGTTPGHELVGEVAALGEGVSNVAVGARVAVEPYFSCGVCQQCRRGRDQLCAKRRLLGFGLPGGMGPFVVAPAARLHPLPERLPWQTAALTEPLAIVLTGMRRAGPLLGQRVLVIGAGTIGLLAAFVASAAGASAVAVAARHPHQRTAALALGATEIVEPERLENDATMARDWDVVVETVGGLTQTLQQALNCAVSGGAVLLLGVHSVPQSLETRRIWLDDVMIVGSFGYGHTGSRPDFADAIDLLARHADRLSPLVTHTRPLAQVAEAFALADDKTQGVIKVVVTQ